MKISLLTPNSNPERELRLLLQQIDETIENLSAHRCRRSNETANGVVSEEGFMQKRKENLLSIGKMAALNHLSVAALRLYDSMGLVRPNYIDPSTGYRYYDMSQNARLDMIAYMKELGMQLSEIHHVLEKEDLALIEEILSEKNDQIHEELRSLRARHDAIERAIASIERYRKSPATDMISLEYIDRRYVWGIPCTENFYEKDINCYEKQLALLRTALVDHGFTQVHTFNIGTSIHEELFRRGQLVADRIFIFCSASLSHDRSDVTVLDSGMYVCIYVDAYDREAECAQKLLDFISEKDLTVSGPYICEVMTEFNVFDSAQRNMFLRLQVPITFKVAESR